MGTTIRPEISKKNRYWIDKHISANLFNKVQQASIASAYALLSSSYKEYRDKLKELHGEDADLEVISNIASEKFPEGKIPEGSELFYDEHSKRYFSMPMEDFILAVYNLNRLGTTN